MADFVPLPPIRAGQSIGTLNPDGTVTADTSWFRYWTQQQQVTYTSITTMIDALASQIEGLDLALINSQIAALQASVAATPAFVEASLAGDSFSTFLLNAVSSAGRGPTVTYPGGSSTCYASCSAWNGAIVTLQKSLDGGATWKTLSGPNSSFGANGQCLVDGLVSGELISALVTGVPGAGITLTLER